MKLAAAAIFTALYFSTAAHAADPTTLPRVANNAALLALPSTQYPSGVVRMGFTNPGDSPPISYVPSNAACSISGGNGDNGSQVKSADGKCWLAVFHASGADIREWGCKIDGSTDDSGCRNAALAWVQASHAKLMQPQGTLAYGTAAVLNSSNWSYECSAGGATHHDVGVSSLATGCTLKWLGSNSQAYMDSIIAPTGSTTDQVLQGIHVNGFSYNCNGAEGALDIQSVRNSTFNLYVTGCNGGEAVTLDVVHATSTNFGEACDSQNNDLRLIVDQRSNTSIGLGVHDWNGPTALNGGCNASVNRIYVDGNINTADMIYDQGGDNNTYSYVRAFTTGGGGNAIDFGVTLNGGVYFPADSEVIQYLSGNAPSLVQGTATGCTVGSTCPYGIQFVHLDAGNNTPAPTLGTGVRPMIDVVWDFSNNTSQPWASFTPTVTCDGTGSLGTVTGVSGNFFKRGETVSFTGAFTTGTLAGGCTAAQMTLPVSSANINYTGGCNGYSLNTGAVITGIIGNTGEARLRQVSPALASNDSQLVTCIYQASN